MNKLRFTLLLMTTLCFLTTYSQESLVYQLPSPEILELADFERAPSLLMDKDMQNMIFAYRPTYKSLEDLSVDEMKLAGLRINPTTNAPSSLQYFDNLKYQKGRFGEMKEIVSLPEHAQMAYFVYSPDNTKVAFTNTTPKGLELWVFDFETEKATKLTEPNLNANINRPFIWNRDSKSLLVKTLPASRKELIEAKKATPDGPIISESDSSTKSANRTYQDLLTNKTDEENFETLITSQLYNVDLKGNKKLWKGDDLYVGENISPDGKYIMITTMHKPYSYTVPLSRFPRTTTIYDSKGNLIKEINDKPLTEEIPKGFMATYEGKRNIDWRKDKPSTLYWVEALDGGDPANEQDFRDAIYEIDAPFSGEGKLLTKTQNRYAGILWGNDDIAVLYDDWWNTRNNKVYTFNPSQEDSEAKILFDLNSEDIYSDPGSFEVEENKFGQNVLKLNGQDAFLIGDGYGPDGQFPFIDQINLSDGTTKRIYQSTNTEQKMNILGIIDADKGEYLVRIESAEEYPNYYVLNTIKRIAPQPITDFQNPFKSMIGVNKKQIKYKRNDGVDLTATLYLPADYDFENKEKLPAIMWAYPTEYKDKDAAGQITSNPNEFIYPYYGSPIYWVNKGYAILDNVSFPIIGEGENQPNDTYIEQLVANAKAAIDAADELGYIDPQRVAVGGHSYGAFMVANLLTHSDLFAAGIARSGAYNRTLTPFGFQSEERTYWESPEVYNKMSPFMHADEMKTPLLLIHGGNDNNSGTFTMQSERYFAALKTNGAPARLVILPLESHGYAAKESVMHTLWEQDQWLEKYVKNKK